MNRYSQLQDKLITLVNEAENAFNIPLPYIDLKFDLKGRSAGQAIRKGSNYSIRLNVDMINNSSFEHIIEDTLPHELAHIICMFTKSDRGHGKVWKSVCKTLGGSGERCHSEQVIPARNTQKFKYITTCGQTITVSKNRHNKIQNGIKYRIKDTGGFLIPESWNLI